jgi:protoheme IX farnesyltransferase
MAHEIAFKGQALPLQLKAYAEMMKLRIGSMIAVSGIMGHIAASGRFQPVQILMLTALLLMSSGAASIFNHVWERDIDAQMTRTQNRPMVTGLIGDPRAPLALSAFLLLAGLGGAFAIFNLLTAVYLFLGAFTYAFVYTVWLKRRSWLNIVVGGLAGSFAVLAGGAAAAPADPLLPLLLAMTLFFWTPSHFWALAILLKDDYARARVPMLTVLVGETATARAIFANSLLLVISAALPWVIGPFGLPYVVPSVLLGLWLLWENWRLVRNPERALARRNFFVSIQYLCGLFLCVLIEVNWPS